MQLEQVIPPARTPSPALRGPGSRPNLRSRRYLKSSAQPSDPLAHAGAPSAWEARGVRRNQTERSARSLSPRPGDHPQAGGARSRTPPALEPAPPRPRTPFAQRTHLLPSDAEVPPLSWSATPSPSSSPESTSVPFLTRAITAPCAVPASRSASHSPRLLSRSPPPPLPRKAYGGMAELAKIGSPRARSPRTHVPSMCEYLSLEQLEDLWCAQDLYVASSITAPQRPRGISMDKILEARAMMPEEGLGIHPAFRPAAEHNFF